MLDRIKAFTNLEAQIKRRYKGGGVQNVRRLRKWWIIVVTRYAK
jgi:hypothetical protein